MLSEQLTPTLAPETGPEGADYLDTYAKVANTPKNNELQQKNLAPLVAKYLYHSGHIKEANRLDNCGFNWVPFSCSNGHKIYHKITCGLPFCPECGKPGSWLNKKRANRVKDVLLGFPMVGHFVFTLPKEISRGLPAPDQISRLYKLAWQILKDVLDAEAAIIVIHFCGDKSSGLHLHFDCSFPILYRGVSGDCSFPLGLLNFARANWTSGINKIFKTSYLDTVGHYNFVNTIEQEHHLIRYITRSTIPAEKFIELTDEQKVFCLKVNKTKVIRYFGAFVGKKKADFLARYKCAVEERGSEDPIDRHICPICNEKMRAREPVFMDDIPLVNFTRHNGYTLIDREIAAFLRQQECRPDRGDFARLEDYLLYKDLGLTLD